EDLRHLAAHRAPRQIHLPKPVLRRDITLGKKEVRQVGCSEMGNAVRVANHRNRRLQAPESDRPIELRHRTLRHAVKPEKSQRARDDKEQHKPDDNLEEHSPGASARYWSSNSCSHGMGL